MVRAREIFPGPVQFFLSIGLLHSDDLHAVDPGGECPHSTRKTVVDVDHAHTFILAQQVQLRDLRGVVQHRKRKRRTRDFGQRFGKIVRGGIIELQAGPASRRNGIYPGPFIRFRSPGRGG